MTIAEATRPTGHGGRAAPAITTTRFVLVDQGPRRSGGPGGLAAPAVWLQVAVPRSVASRAGGDCHENAGRDRGGGHVIGRDRAARYGRRRTLTGP